MMFEQELYNNFSIYLPRPYFITFAGDVSFPFFFCTFSPSSSLFYLRPIEKCKDWQPTSSVKCHQVFSKPFL